MDTQEAISRLRESTGMSRKEFCEYFGIPYRTLQDWELGKRHMPEYLFNLMEYKIDTQKLSKNKKKSKI